MRVAKTFLNTVGFISESYISLSMFTRQEDPITKTIYIKLQYIL